MRPLLLLIPALLASCHGLRDSRIGADEHEFAHTLVILRTGPRTEPLTREESAHFFGGHFANMERLLENGDLLLAGPFGNSKSASDLRGIFILDTDDLDRARALAETDPCFAAGVFRFEFHPLRTRFPLRDCAAAIREQLAAAEREGVDLPPGHGCRNYVLLTVADHLGARAIAMTDAVCMQARIDDRRAMLVLACDDIETARAAVEPFAQGLGEHVLDEWFATDLLLSLRR